MSRTPTNGIDYTSKDYESFRNDMIKQLGIKMPEYTDIRQSDAGIVLLELLAQGLDVISYYQDVLANEVYLTTAEQRSNVLKWCQILGYTPRASTPAEFSQVFVLVAPQTTDTIIPAGTKVKTKGSSTEPEIYYETAYNLKIPAGELGNETDDKGNYKYYVQAIQGVTITGERLGSSTGSKDQSFKLTYSPVILDSISVLVNEGKGFETWYRVESFVDSTPTSKHFMASINDNNEATITFGDGVFGKIPTVYENGIYCDYRVGGGTQGNVGVNKICLLDSNIALVAETFNPSIADVMGQDKESLSSIKANASSSYKNIWGALTVSDFAEVTKANFPEVDKAASYKNSENPLDVDLYVLLKEDRPLTDYLANEILNLFDENNGGRKIIGSGFITVLSPMLTPIDITAVLGVKPRYDFETVKANILAFLEDYFSIGNRDFDMELSLPSLASEIMNPENAIEGIRYFKIVSPEDDVLIPVEGEIFTVGDFTIIDGGA